MKITFLKWVICKGNIMQTSNLVKQTFKNQEPFGNKHHF